MAIPTPESLIGMVKPVLTEPADFITALSTQMADADIVKYAYRGQKALFTFYVEGYMTTPSIMEVTKQLTDAGYEVVTIQQRVGYIPPVWMYDNTTADHTDPGVTGTQQSTWFEVSIRVPKSVYAAE